MALTIVGLNVLGWVMLAAAVSGHYQLSGTGTKIFGFGTGVLAYTLGMRHAFDADHIAAIDNTTRKLIQDGKRPLSVGYFFSLGHSTVVFVLAVLLNFGIRALNSQVKDNSSGLHHWTGIVGTLVSGIFLYLIALLNLIVLASIIKVSREMRQGRYDDAELERQLDNRGLMNRFLGGMPSASTRPGRSTRSECSSAWASTPPPKWPCWSWPARPRSAASRSTPCCPCPSCSPPACASSTPWMAVS